MTTEMIISNLGSLLPAGMRYSETSNVFITNGYVSAANNVYFNAIRFAEGIVIKEDVGQGYAHSFLNGIRIYSLKDRVLLADKSYHCCFYSKGIVLQESKEMLIQLIYDAALNSGFKLNKAEVERVVERVLTEAFDTNQLELAQSQVYNLKQIG